MSCRKADQALTFQVHKEWQKLNTKEIKLTINKWTKRFSKERRRKNKWPIASFKSVRCLKQSEKYKSKWLSLHRQNGCHQWIWKHRMERGILTYCWWWINTVIVEMVWRSPKTCKLELHWTPLFYCYAYLYPGDSTPYRRDICTPHACYCKELT